MTACVVRLDRPEMTARGLAQLRLDRLDNPGWLPNGCRVCPASRGDFPATTGGLEAVADSRPEFAWRLHWLAFRETVEHGLQFAVTCTAYHLSTTRKGGGSCWCPTFFCRPASAPNTTPDSPCVFGSATLGTLGRKLTTLFRPDVTVRGSFCSCSPFIYSFCVIFYFRPHPSRTQIVKHGTCEGNPDMVGRLQRRLDFDHCTLYTSHNCIWFKHVVSCVFLYCVDGLHGALMLPHAGRAALPCVG